MFNLKLYYAKREEITKLYIYIITTDVKQFKDFRRIYRFDSDVMIKTNLAKYISNKRNDFGIVCTYSGVDGNGKNKIFLSECSPKRLRYKLSKPYKNY